MKAKLTREEKKISNDIAEGKYQSLPESKKRRYSDLARDQIRHGKAGKKNARINIRLTNEDLVNLKKRAEEEGLPYQTLVNSIIHKFLSGRLVESRSLRRTG